MRRVLARVDDDLAAADGKHACVEPLQNARVPHEGRTPAAERRGGQRQLAVAIHRPRRRQRVVRVEPVPAAKRVLPDRPPERAVMKRRAAAAEIVVAQPALPEMAHLAHRHHPRLLGQQHVEHGASAAAQPTNEQHRDRRRARTGGPGRPLQHLHGQAPYAVTRLIGLSGRIAGAGSRRRSRHSRPQAIITTYMVTGRKS